MTTAQTTPEVRAERAQKILAADTPVVAQGVTFVTGDDSGCVMAMSVTQDQCNSHGICHGGITMFLADTAAAYALNTGEEEPCWVTSTSQSTFVAPVKSGANLNAHAMLHARSGRSCLVDVRLADQEGKIVLETRNMMVRLI